MAKRFDRAIASVAERQFGLVTRSHLLAMGLSPNAVAQRAATGQLVCVHSGVYAVVGAPRTWEQGALAALLAAGADSALSHGTAGRFWKLDGMVSDGLDLIVSHTRRLRLDGVVVHRSRTLAPGDIVRRPPLRVTSPARTVMDLAGVLGTEALEDVLDDALRRQLLSSRGLLQRLGDRRKGMPGAGRLRRLLEDRVGKRGPGSALETRFRRRLLKTGLPAPVAQYEVRDGGRLIARVDFAYPDVRLAIEIDGFAFHSGRKRWESDLARQNALLAAGWRVLRFTSTDVDCPAVMRSLERVLRTSGEPNSQALGRGFPRKRRTRA